MVSKKRKFELHENVEEYLLKNAKKYSVLYVDDDESYRDIMKDILEMFFDKVTIAQDGAEALDVYKEHAHDLVITDIEMPKKNGLQLIEEIQALNLEVGFIVLTGFIKNEHLLKALELGINKYLIKPIDKEKFYELLYKCIFDLEFINQFEMMQEEKELLNLALELSPVFTVLEKDGNIKYVNHSFLEFLGYKNYEECVEQYESLFTLIKNESSKQAYKNYKEYMNSALDYEKNDRKVFLEDKNGELKAFQLTNKFYPNISTLISVFTDINDIDKNTKQLKKLSEVDALTNIYNKYKFDDYFATVYKNYQAKKYESVSLAMIYIDDLLEIDSQYGSHVGDKVIRSVANFIKNNLIEGEFLARYSSEVFVVVFKNMNLENAFKRSDVLRLDIVKQYKSKLTCSFGVVEFRHDDKTEDILLRANTAILKAKKGGKNLVIVSV